MILTEATAAASVVVFRSACFGFTTPPRACADSRAAANSRIFTLNAMSSPTSLGDGGLVPDARCRRRETINNSTRCARGPSRLFWRARSSGYTADDNMPTSSAPSPCRVGGGHVDVVIVVATAVFSSAAASIPSKTESIYYYTRRLSTT